MTKVRCLPVLVLIALLGGASCSIHKQLRSNALEFLYPAGSPASPPADVRLKLPVRVGLAFAPPSTPREDTFTEVQKQDLLARVAEAFHHHEGIGAVEAIPSNHLRPAGSFANLDAVRAAFGTDLIVLISYDQFQFSETGRSSWAYWTIAGAYLVKGERNETRTVLDAVVYDIESRAMLFHASGQNRLEGRATPIDSARRLRQQSEGGFAGAAADLIVNLETALTEFQRQASTGTVRGAGTPAIAMYDQSGARVGPGADAGQGAATGGGGAAGVVEILAAALLIVLGRLGRRTERRPGIGTVPLDHGGDRRRGPADRIRAAAR